MVHVKISNNVIFGNDLPFVLMAGPCQIESIDHSLFMCDELLNITSRLSIPLVFKSSFDKANRTSVTGKRGIGFYAGLEALEKVKEKFHVPTITDVHEKDQCGRVASVVDILQIPAFLCRQTDLLQAAAETKNPLHIKKGQFLAPWDMEQVAKKVESFGNKNILLCDRGTSFGYNTLVSDFRGLPIMAKTGYPVVFDATHSVQQPGGLGGSSGGQREFVPTLAKAAIAVGVSGLFIETHQDPDNSPSDGPNMVPLNEMSELLKRLKELDELVKSW